MKKFTVLVLLVSFLSAGAFAADAKPVAKAEAGVVVSYTPAVAAVAADTAKKIVAVAAAPAVLVVKVGTASETLLIDAKTLVEGKDLKVIDIATLKAGDKVEVTSTEDKKVLTAVSVILK